MTDTPDSDLSSAYLAFYAQAFQAIAARARTLSGTELKISLHLAAIANPLTRTAESSQGELADHFRTSKKHIRRALDSLEDRGMVGGGDQPGPLKTVYHLIFMDTEFFPTGVKMTPVTDAPLDPTGVKMTPVTALLEATGVKMTPVTDLPLEATGVKMTPVGGVQEPFPGMVLGIDPRARDSRARVDSRFDSISTDRSIDRLSILDKCFTAKPTDFDPQLLAKASGMMHSYSAKLGRDPYTKPPDNEIVAQFLAVAEWPRLEALITQLVHKRQEPGASPAWFVTVALEQIHDIKPKVQKQRRTELRLEKGLRPTKSIAPPEGFTGDQGHDPMSFEEEIQKLANAKGMR